MPKTTKKKGPQSVGSKLDKIEKDSHIVIPVVGAILAHLAENLIPSKKVREHFKSYKADCLAAIEQGGEKTKEEVTTILDGLHPLLQKGVKTMINGGVEMIKEQLDNDNKDKK